MSSILVDNLTGKTTAGNVTVTSEHGAKTMQLQQGLAKAWTSWTTNTNHSVYDSLNNAGIVDGGTGITTLSYTNLFNNVDYTATTGTAMYASSGDQFAYETWPKPGTNATDSHAYTGGFNNNTGSNITPHDMGTGNRCYVANFGDLA